MRRHIVQITPFEDWQQVTYQVEVTGARPAIASKKEVTSNLQYSSARWAGTILEYETRFVSEMTEMDNPPAQAGGFFENCLRIYEPAAGGYLSNILASALLIFSTFFWGSSLMVSLTTPRHTSSLALASQMSTMSVPLV